MNFSVVSALERLPAPEVKRTSALVLKKPFLTRLLSAVGLSASVTVTVPEAACLIGFRPLPTIESSPRSGSASLSVVFEPRMTFDFGAVIVPGASNFALPGLASSGGTVGAPRQPSPWHCVGACAGGTSALTRAS